MRKKETERKNKQAGKHGVQIRKG